LQEQEVLEAQVLPGSEHFWLQGINQHLRHAMTVHLLAHNNFARRDANLRQQAHNVNESAKMHPKGDAVHTSPETPPHLIPKRN